MLSRSPPPDCRDSRRPESAERSSVASPGVRPTLATDRDGPFRQGIRQRDGTVRRTLRRRGRTMAVTNPDVNGKTNVWNNYRWDSGAVRVYYYQSEQENPATLGWTQMGNDIIGENEDDYAGAVYGGHPVAISGDGRTVVMGVGQNAGGEGAGTSVGHARVYTYDPEDSDWRQVGVDIDGDADEDRFGDAVAVSGNGRVVAVGARQDLNSNSDNARGSGYARAFRLAEECDSHPSYSPTDPMIWSLSHIDIENATALPTYSPTTAKKMTPSQTTLAPTNEKVNEAESFAEGATASSSGVCRGLWTSVAGSVLMFVFMFPSV